MTDKTETLNFEKSFESLQAIIKRLESSELPLEEALKLFEEGQALIQACSSMLEAAQLRVETINPDKETAKE